MTILELIERLKEYPGNMPVMVAQDAEGNGFESLHEISAYYFNEHDEIVGHGGTDDKSGLTIKLVVWP